MNQNPTLYPADRPMPATVHAVSTDLDASHRSAVSWSAIFAGAAGAAADPTKAGVSQGFPIFAEGMGGFVAFLANPP